MGSAEPASLMALVIKKGWRRVLAPIFVVNHHAPPEMP